MAVLISCTIKFYALNRVGEERLFKINCLDLNEVPMHLAASLRDGWLPRKGWMHCNGIASEMRFPFYQSFITGWIRQPRPSVLSSIGSS